MEKQQDNTLAWVSYLTIIGWIIAIVMYNDSQKGNTLVRFHLRQSLGLYLLGIAGSIIAIIPILGWLIWITVSIGVLVFWILGIISAVQSEEKPVPVVGDLFQDWFSFIN